MAERDFQTELMRGILDAGGHAYKIPDLPYALAKRANYVERKPYDCYWNVGGHFHALELKQVAAGLSFPMSQLRDHQEENLLAVSESGGTGWVVVNFRVRLSARQQKLRGAEVLDRAFAVPIDQVVLARTVDARTGLPLEWWEQRAVELPRQRGPAGITWDPRPLARQVES